MPNNGGEFGCMLTEKLMIILKFLKSENLHNNENMCMWQLNRTVPRGL